MYLVYNGPFWEAELEQVFEAGFETRQAADEAEEQAAAAEVR